MVQRPLDTNIVDSKWIFHTKFNVDNFIERHKARFVAQGFTQIRGVDFHHTSSLVVKAATDRIILALSDHHS